MLLALIAGLTFSLLAYMSNLFCSDQILSVGILKNFEAAQILLFALSISSLAFFIEFSLGDAVINVKPFYLVGIIVGGLLFGVGVGILGYCPGTLEMAIGYGSIDALFGFIGGLTAGYFYTMIYPVVLPFLGPNYGAINFYSSNSIFNTALVLAFSIGLFCGALALQNPNNRIMTNIN
jgi:uncharacterized protein